MLYRTLKTLAIAALSIVAAAWLFNLIFAPKFLYSLSSSTRSEDGARRLTLGDLNPYPLSRECYRYLFVHPADVVLDARRVQWEYLVAQFDCNGEVSATWLSAARVEITTKRVENGSLPRASVQKSSDGSGHVRVSYVHGA